MPRFQQLSLNEGLLHNNVYSLFEDRDGFIWVGSGGGLQRYDGKNFKEYSVGKPNILTSSEIRIITQTADGAIWISQSGNRLFRLEYGQFKVFNSKENESHGLDARQVFCLVPNPDSSLWVGTENGLRLYRDGVFHNVLNKDVGPVRAILRNADGSLYLSLGGKGLYHYANDTQSEVKGVERNERLKGKLINKIIRKENGNIIMAIEGSLIFEYNSLTDTVWSLPDSPNPITNIQAAHNNVLWIGSAEGLLEYRNGTFARIIENHGDPNGLTSNMVLTSLMDSKGRLWLGTYGGGINILLNSGFTSIKYLPEKFDGLKNRVIKSIQLDDEGTLWIGSQDNGLYTYKDERAYRPRTLNGMEISNQGNITTIYQDTKNAEWFLGPEGIFKHENGKISQIDFNQNNAQAIVEQDNGIYWIADFTQGLSKLENKKILHFNEHDAQLLQSNNIQTLGMGREHDLWVGHYNNGIDIVKDDKVVESFFHNQGDTTTLSNDRITCIFRAADSTVWVGTNYGLNKYDYDSHSFKRYFSYDGLISNTIQAINEDHNGRIWISTINGISKFDPKSEVFTNYGLEDGVDTYPFSLYCTTRDKKTGRLYFGGENGITTFHPDSIFLHTTPPNTEILRVSVLGRHLSCDTLSKLNCCNEILKLEHEQNILDIEFIAPNFQSVAYSYLLSGFETQWKYSTESNIVHYTKIPPGRYTFKVRAKTKNSGYWGQTKSFVIVILPPFWKRLWFRGVIIVLIAIIVWIIFNLRIKGIKKRNSLLEKEIGRRKVIQKELEMKNGELERFTYTVSHDLKSPLITIRGFLGLIREDIRQNELEAVENDINTIESATEKMRKLQADKLENNRNGRLSNDQQLIKTNAMIEQVVSFFKKEIGDQQITIEIEKELPEIKGDKTRIYEVFQNLIGNSIKYIGNGLEKRVKIGHSVKNDDNTFYISDTGIGIDPKFSKKVFDLFERLEPEIEGTGIGLAIVKRVIEVHQGKIWVESEGKGKGSTFFFTLPNT